jgi:hypothetical protein
MRCNLLGNSVYRFFNNGLYVMFKLCFLVSQYACGIFSVLLIHFRESLKVIFVLCNDSYVGFVLGSSHSLFYKYLCRGKLVYSFL